MEIISLNKQYQKSSKWKEECAAGEACSVTDGIVVGSLTLSLSNKRNIWFMVKLIKLDVQGIKLHYIKNVPHKYWYLARKREYFKGNK